MGFLWDFYSASSITREMGLLPHALSSADVMIYQNLDTAHYRTETMRAIFWIPGI